GAEKKEVKTEALTSRGGVGCYQDSPMTEHQPGRMADCGLAREPDVRECGCETTTRGLSCPILYHRASTVAIAKCVASACESRKRRRQPGASRTSRMMRLSAVGL